MILRREDGRLCVVEGCSDGCTTYIMIVGIEWVGIVVWEDFVGLVTFQLGPAVVAAGGDVVYFLKKIATYVATKK